jgi:hypothetical protein
MRKARKSDLSNPKEKPGPKGPGFFVAQFLEPSFRSARMEIKKILYDQCFA